jgi:hypothetical protein
VEPRLEETRWSRRRNARVIATDVAIVMLPLLFVLVALFAVILSGGPEYSSLIPNWLNRVFQLFVWASIAGNLLSSLFPRSRPAAGVSRNSRSPKTRFVRMRSGSKAAAT